MINMILYNTDDKTYLNKLFVVLIKYKKIDGEEL